MRPSAIFDAVAAGAEPSRRAGRPLLLDRFSVVARAADSVAARAVVTERAAVACFLERTTGVAALGGHAVAAGALVTERAPSHFWEGLDGLLGYGTADTQGSQSHASDQAQHHPLDLICWFLLLLLDHIRLRDQFPEQLSHD